MGQYYKIVQLESKNRNTATLKKVGGYLSSYDYGNGAKLMEFGYINNHFMGALESLIKKDEGAWAGMPIVIAGDYAKDEPRTFNRNRYNVYDIAVEFGKKLLDIPSTHCRYCINEDTKEFVDCERVTPSDDGLRIHPLAILLAEGNGRGGGDYNGTHMDKVGAWARNIVVVSDTKPDNSYKEIFYDFKEEY